MSVLINVIAIEVLVNVSRKLRNLIDGDRLAVAPLNLSEHPLPINDENGIELGIAVHNSLGLDAQELQPADHGILKRRALGEKQALQNACVFKRRLQLLLILGASSLFLRCFGLQQRLAQPALIGCLELGVLNPIGRGCGVSATQFCMDPQEMTDEVYAVSPKCGATPHLKVECGEKDKVPTSFVLYDCAHNMIGVLSREQWL